jgi:elongation factor 2
MVVKHLPNPLDAQKYRIPKIWKGELESEFGKDLISCNPNGKLGFVITRIVIEPKSGKEISAGRLFSGTFKPGMEVYLNLAKKRQRVQQVLIYNGVRAEQIDEIGAGNVLAISGVTGEAGESVTLNEEVPFEELKHIFEPVITKAIEATKPSDLPKLVEVLQKVAKEDPSIKVEINQETGENLMSGMGELHLEIIENRIRTEKGLDVKTSPPIVVYREHVLRKNAVEAEGKSPNKHNKLYFYVEPLSDELTEAIRTGKVPEGRVKKKSDELVKALVEFGVDRDEAKSVKDVFRSNIFVDDTRGVIAIGEIMDLVLDMFEDVMSYGPMAKEPCIGVKITLADAKLHEDAIHRGPGQIYPAVREGIRMAFAQAGAVLFEPVQKMEFEAPNEYLGTLTNLIQSKRGQLQDIQQEKYIVKVIAKLPVAETIGLSNDLRGATEGRAMQYLIDQTFERVPGELQPIALSKIRSRKGLAEGEVYAG